MANHNECQQLYFSKGLVEKRRGERIRKERILTNFSFCFVLFCFVLFCFVLFCFVLFYYIGSSIVKRRWKRGEWEEWEPGEKIESQALYLSADKASFIGKNNIFVSSNICLFFFFCDVLFVWKCKKKLFFFL